MHCAMALVVDSNEAGAAAELAAVPGWFVEWEQRFSRFRDDSELSRLNRDPAVHVAVSALMAEVLGVALDATRLTEGLVTPTVLGALEAAGYDRSFERLEGPSRATAATPASCGRDLLRLDADRSGLERPVGVRLDLGGVVKGWAADRVASSVRGCALLVDAAGDIAVNGPRADGRPWCIGVASPFVEGDTLCELLLRCGGVATSGRDRRRWQRDGHWLHHVIDPRTGAPADTDVLTATVVGPSAAAAEAVAKAVLIRGSVDGLRWLDGLPQFAGLVACEDGRVLESCRLGAFRAHPVG